MSMGVYKFYLGSHKSGKNEKYPHSNLFFIVFNLLLIIFNYLSSSLSSLSSSTSSNPLCLS